MLREREEEFLWESIVVLQETNHLEHAKAVFKSGVEKTLSLLRHPTDFLADAVIEIPSKEEIGAFRHLHLQIKQCLQTQDLDRANELLVDYIALLSHACPDAEPPVTQKKLIAHLLSGQSRTAVEKMDAYTTSEAAEILGVSDQTIRRMLDKGKFPDAQQTLGGHWRIPKKYFIADVEQSRKAEAFMRKIDQKNAKAGEVDEFDLL